MQTHLPPSHAPFRVKTSHWRSLLVFGFALTLGCGTKTTASTDTRTNWLTSCADDANCGNGLDCLCGVCTRQCTDDETCSGYGNQAACIDSPSGCPRAPRVCATSGFEFPNEDHASTASSDASSLATRAEGSSTEAEQSGVSTSGENNGSSNTSSSSSASVVDSTAPFTSAEMSSDGGADAGTDPCDIPGRRYTSRVPEECTTVVDCGVLAEGVGDVPFNDACGCGCEPYVPPERTDMLLQGTCLETPSGGNPVAARVLVESELSAIACDDVPSALLRSEAEVAQWQATSGCSSLGDVATLVDFDTETLVIWGVPERPAASVTDVTQTIDGIFHIGVNTLPYCGGARPLTGFVVLTLPVGRGSAVIARVETCYADCERDGGLPPP